MADPRVVMQLLGGSTGPGVGGGATTSDGGGKGAEPLTNLAETLGAQSGKISTLGTLFKQTSNLLPGAAQSVQKVVQTLQQLVQVAGQAGTATQKTVQAMQVAAKAAASQPSNTASMAQAVQAASKNLGLQMQSGTPAKGLPNLQLQSQTPVPDIHLEMAPKGQGDDLLLELEKDKKKGKGGAAGAAKVAKTAAAVLGEIGSDDGSKKKRRGAADSGGQSSAMHVIIDGPFPLRVIDEASRKEAAVHGKTKSASGSGGGGMGGIAALGAAAGVMGAIAGSTAPAVMQTLAGSLQLVGLEVTTVFVPAIMKASQLLQRLAHEIRYMDEGTKKAIAEKIKFAGALGAVAMVATRLAPALTMVGGALKGLVVGIAGLGLPGLVVGLAGATAAAALFGDEIAEMLPPEIGGKVAQFGEMARGAFAMIWEQAGPGLAQLGETLTELAGTLLPAVADLAVVLGQAFADAAPLIGQLLVGALQAAAQGITWFVQGAQAIYQWFNNYLPGGIEVAVTAIIAFRVAWVAATAIIAATSSPIVLVTTAIAGLVAGIGYLTSANDKVALSAKRVTDELAQQLATAERLQPILERVRGGGKVEGRDLKQAVSAEDEARLRAAGTPEAQKRELERIRDEAKAQSGGKTVEEIDREAAEHAAALKKAVPQMSDAEARKITEEQISKKRAAAQRAELAQKAIDQGGIDFSGKPGAKTIDKAKDIGKEMKEGVESAIKKATEGAASGPGAKTADSKKPAFQPVMALPSQFAGQFSSIEQARKTLISANIKAPLEAKILEAQQKQTNEAIRANATLEKIDKKLDAQKPSLIKGVGDM